MPRKKIYGKKRYRRKKSITKYPRNKITSGGIYGGPSVIPDRLHGTMYYCSILKRTTAAGIPDLYKYRTNDVYDPDLTGTGLSASQFNIISLLYNKFRVVASKIKVDVVNDSANSGIFMSVVPYVNDTLVNTDYTSIMSNPMVRSIMLGQYQDKATVTNYVNNKKLCGDRGYMIDDRNVGSSSSSPSLTYVWAISSFPSDGVSALAYSAHITVKYYVEWFDRVTALEN